MGQSQGASLRQVPFEVYAKQKLRDVQESIAAASIGLEEELEEKVVRYITVKDITIRELKACAIPDTSLTAVWVRLVDKVQHDHDYLAVHAPCDAESSRILVCTNTIPEIPGLDSHVHQITKLAVRMFGRDRITVGTRYARYSYFIQDPPKQRILNFRCPVFINAPLTKEDIGGLVWRYKSKFHAAHILRAYFSHIPEESYANPQLPDGKVITKGIYPNLSLRGIGHLPERLPDVCGQPSSIVVNC